MGRGGQSPRVAMGKWNLDRRQFMATGIVGGLATTLAGSAWLGTSNSWPARLLREQLDGSSGDVQPAPHRPEPDTWSDNAVTLAWLGHATVLINFYGVRILTDPALFSRIGVDLIVGTIGPQRLTQCALQAGELPDIDLVLVSHAHFDHLDTPSLGVIRGAPIAVMAPGTADLLPRRAYSAVHELRWNDAKTVRTRRGDVLVRALEVKHWGARIRRDTWRGYTGFAIEREGARLLIGGDTANTPVFSGHRRYGPYDAAVMPVGAYDPWIRNHCTPEQAVALADAAGARLFVPVHHQTFELSREPFHEPIERTRAALGEEEGRIAISAIGQTTVVRT